MVVVVVLAGVEAGGSCVELLECGRVLELRQRREEGSGLAGGQSAWQLALLEYLKVFKDHSELSAGPVNFRRPRFPGVYPDHVRTMWNLMWKYCISVRTISADKLLIREQFCLLKRTGGWERRQKPSSGDTSEGGCDWVEGDGVVVSGLFGSPGWTTSDPDRLLTGSHAVSSGAAGRLFAERVADGPLPPALPLSRGSQRSTLSPNEKPFNISLSADCGRCLGGGARGGAWRRGFGGGTWGRGLGAGPWGGAWGQGLGAGAGPGGAGPWGGALGRGLGAGPGGGGGAWAGGGPGGGHAPNDASA
ncbi:unnamed protein product [Gadus morhua 'NCC']